MRVDGSRIWKEKVADLNGGYYVWTGPYVDLNTSITQANPQVCLR